MIYYVIAGFRAIGFNLLISFLAMVIINGAFSYSTLEVRWLVRGQASCFALCNSLSLYYSRSKNLAGMSMHLLYIDSDVNLVWSQKRSLSWMLNIIHSRWFCFGCKCVLSFWQVEGVYSLCADLDSESHVSNLHKEYSQSKTWQWLWSVRYGGEVTFFTW